MADYHTTYTGPEGETTQWDDIQVRLGNKAPPPPKHVAEKFEPERQVEKNAEWLGSKDEAELSDLEDDFDDDRYLEAIRQRRIEEMRTAATRPRFGSLEYIRGGDFQQMVTERSTSAWVLVLLFKEEHEGCTLLMEVLQQLASKYAHNAFVKIISTDCIPNYPDAHLPTVLLYHEEVALVLNQVGPICRRPDDDGQAEEPEMHELKGLVKRMVLQRQQQADANGHDSSDSE